MTNQCADRLNVNKCYSKQNDALLRAVIDAVSKPTPSRVFTHHVHQALEAFPVLDDYEHCWPVTDLIKMHLKYTSVRARRAARSRDAGEDKKDKKDGKAAARAKAKTAQPEVSPYSPALMGTQRLGRTVITTGASCQRKPLV